MIRHFIALRVPLRAFQVLVDQVSIKDIVKSSKIIKLCFSLTGTQALVRSGSPNSSLSADDRATILPICRAKAIVDSTPFPYEKDALKFKVS